MDGKKWSKGFMRAARPGAPSPTKKNGWTVEPLPASSEDALRRRQRDGARLAALVSTDAWRGFLVDDSGTLRAPDAVECRGVVDFMGDAGAARDAGRGTLAERVAQTYVSEHAGPCRYVSVGSGGCLADFEVLAWADRVVGSSRGVAAAPRRWDLSSAGSDRRRPGFVTSFKTMPSF